MSRGALVLWTFVCVILMAIAGFVTYVGVLLPQRVHVAGEQLVLNLEEYFRVHGRYPDDWLEVAEGKEYFEVLRAHSDPRWLRYNLFDDGSMRVQYTHVSLWHFESEWHNYYSGDGTWFVDWN